MPQVGRGVSIPFVVDFTDIPRSVKNVEKILQTLRKRVGDVELRIGSKKIEQLGKETLKPMIKQFGKIEESAKLAAARIDLLTKAIRTMRSKGTVGGMDKGTGEDQTGPSMLSLFPGIGPKTLEQITKARAAILAGDKDAEAQRLRAIQLLKRARTHNQMLLNQTKQIVAVEASPVRTRAQRILLEYTKRLTAEMDQLLIKRRLNIITDKESIRLAQLMVQYKKATRVQSEKYLALQRQVNTEAALAMERLRKDTGGLMAGLRSVFTWRRAAWFLWLRALWSIYRIIGKIKEEMYDLDEAIARSMRTMMSNTESYSKVAKTVHDAVLKTAAKTGAAYRSVGEALYQLSSAGLTAENALAAVDSVMLLVQTTEAEVTDVTKVVAGIFNNFREQLRDTTDDAEAFMRISAVLGYVWRHNQIDMNELVQALNQSAQAAQLANIRFEELTVIMGNLGTQMIRGGRGGRSLRAAVAQMAAKGRELSKIFGIVFEPGKPLDFMDVIEQIHKKWVAMNKSAVITNQLFKIFGLRAAPAIQSILDNFTKINKEINESTEYLKRATEQYEVLLHQQERYRQVLERAWKMMFEEIPFFEWFFNIPRRTLSDLMLARDTMKAFAGWKTDLMALRDVFGGTGKLMDEMARAQARLNILMEEGAVEEQVAIWKRYVEQLKKAIEFSKKLDKQTVVHSKIDKSSIKAKISAEDALRQIIDQDLSERGKLVIVRDKAAEQLKREIEGLNALKLSWEVLYDQQAGNTEAIKDYTKDVLDHSKAVEKLSETLLKLSQLEEDVAKKKHKDDLSFYDARIKLQETYMRERDRWTGVAEQRESAIIDDRIERLMIERSQIKELLQAKQAYASIYKQAAKEGELPSEVVQQWNQLKVEITDLGRNAEITEKAIKELITQQLFLGRQGVGARFNRPADVNILGSGERPTGAFARELEYNEQQMKKRHQFEKDMLDEKLAAQEKYSTKFSWWKTQEQVEEEESNARRREALDLERTQIEERLFNIRQQIEAQDNLAETTFDKDVATNAIARSAALQQEEADLQRQLELTTQQYNNAKLTYLEYHNTIIRGLVKQGNYVGAAKATWAAYGETIKNYAGQMTEAWKEMFAFWGQKSKGAWDAYKAISIAQAIVDTFKTAQAGAASLAGIPFVGPALAAAWIATSIATGMMRVRQIEAQKPAQQYAQGGISYGTFVANDRRRGRSASYATGGVTSGVQAIYGDNPSGRELVIPSENVSDDSASGYIRQKGESQPVVIYNLVTTEDIAAAMTDKSGQRVIVNAVGKDMREKKSTYQANRSR